MNSQEIRLSSLDLKGVQQDVNGRPKANTSLKGNPLTIGGRVFEHGIGTHANCEIVVRLNGEAARFRSMVGIDDETKGKGTVKFRVYVDEKLVVETPVIKGGEPAVEVSADLTGAETLRLFLHDADDWHGDDHGDWAEATITMAPGANSSPFIPLPDPEPKLAIARTDNMKLGIHGADIVGTTPGNDFVFLIPATGIAPLTFRAEKLPTGLSLDAATGIITGSVDKAGEHDVLITVKDASGEASRYLRIVAGHRKLALTPPMGWNSWNVWGGAVDAEKVKAAADHLVETGLASHGFQYINIDDTWEDKRNEKGEILPNKKFPDMKGLADYVHSKGLKLGIYSSPGPKTCGGYEGSYQHELQDAHSYAQWGIDYLKHDWCSYGQVLQPNTRENCQKPYIVMRDALDKSGRDIVYSLCQYGMDNVWEWGGSPEVGGNLWRTTGDIVDNWRCMSNIGFNQDTAAAYSKPGQWNDPDMLVVGRLGWGPDPQPCRLTNNEQITHISLWSLLAAPLLIGCDLTRMDQFTIDLLSNDEVIAIDQDQLGIAARRRSQVGDLEVWARPLEDGTTAVGLFNRGFDRAEVTAKWQDIGVTGKQHVRDLWQRKELGIYDLSFTTTVPAHGCVLVKVGTPNS